MTQTASYRHFACALCNKLHSKKRNLSRSVHDEKTVRLHHRAIEGLGVSSGTVSCGVILKCWNPFDIGFFDDPLRRNHWLVGFFGFLCRLYGTVRGLSGSLGPTGAARRQRRLYSSRSLAAVKQDGNCHTPLHSFDMYILQLLCSVSFFFFSKKKFQSKGRLNTMPESGSDASFSWFIRQFTSILFFFLFFLAELL